jgi:hypothetical protein
MLARPVPVRSTLTLNGVEVADDSG